MATNTKLHGRQLKNSTLPRIAVDQDFEQFLSSLALKTEVEAAKSDTTIIASNGLEKDATGIMTVKVGTLVGFNKDNAITLKTENLFKRGLMAGAIDGSNKTFQYSENYAPFSESLILNGLILFAGEDYTIDYSLGEVTLNDPPQVGDRLWCTGAVIES